MPTVIPEKFQDLLEKKIFVSLATLMPDGRPQVTPVWFDFDGQHVVINSAKGRVKDRNMRRDPRVALLFIDPENRAGGGDHRERRGSTHRQAGEEVPGQG